MAKLFAKSEDPDQMLDSAASDLGLHSLPITLLGVSRYNGIKSLISIAAEYILISNKTVCTKCQSLFSEKKEEKHSSR